MNNLKIKLQKNYISWIGEFSPTIFLNSIVLGLGVGFAEEIIFRGWLLEELKFEYGAKISIALQAIIFASFIIYQMRSFGT